MLKLVNKLDLGSNRIVSFVGSSPTVLNWEELIKKEDKL